MIIQRLPFQEWSEIQTGHHNRVYARIGAYLQQRHAQGRDPVTDFLFEYYSFRPSLLARWSPGAGVLLMEAQLSQFSESMPLKQTPEGAYLEVTLPEKRVQALHWVIGMLEKTASRPPKFGCMGLHEWAMVYKTTPRHGSVPLRLSPEETNEVVERFPVRCTHYDAFRFFSERARPMNQFQPSRETFDQWEQPGCLHTNMDLYKWAYKYYPFVSSELIWNCFELAWDIRQLDMQASPYDLRSRGLEPVCIETQEGQAEYRRRQEGFYQRSIPLRAALLKQLRFISEQVVSIPSS